MKLSTLRANLEAFLGQNIQHTSEELRTPVTSSEAMLFISPIREVTYSGTIPDIRISATVSFTVTYWYPSSYLYHTLPLGYLEGLWNTTNLVLIVNHSSIGMDSLTIDQPINPINIRDTGDNTGEWLVDLTWEFQFTAVVEPESYTPGVSPYDVDNINIRLFRNSLDDSTITLDRTIDIDASS